MYLPCWNCGDTCANPHICGQCSSILPTPPQADHFQILGIERRYVVDLEGLRQAYLSLSRKFHPDRFGKKSLRERRIAVEKSAAINAAYKTLLDPIKRAEYLLIKEANLKDLDQLRADPDLLEEVMETRERIADLKENPSEDSQKKLLQEKERAQAEERRILSRLEELFRRFDNHDCSVLSEVEREVIAHRYNKGILQELSHL